MNTSHDILQLHYQELECADPSYHHQALKSPAISMQRLRNLKTASPNLSCRSEQRITGRIGNITSSNILAVRALSKSPLIQGISKYSINKDMKTKERDFDQGMYDQVEKFLDKEGLYIISPSPIISHARLKPSSRMKLQVYACKVHQNLKLNSETVLEQNNTRVAMPSFLLKRVNLNDLLPDSLA